MELHSEDQARLRFAFRHIASHLPDLSRMFYLRMFEIDPSCRALFADDLTTQRRRFEDMVAFIFGAIDDPGFPVDRLRNLASRQVTYGVQTRHYNAARLALTDAVTSALGKEFTTDVSASWEKGLDWIMSNMTD